MGVIASKVVKSLSCSTRNLLKYVDKDLDEDSILR